MGEERLVTEVPDSLKKLARKVVRGFYTIEDALIIDLLVRNPCMKEDDICELLKFERKMLRARIAILRNDKFIQVRLKMETGLDGKAQKVNYYFINYKVTVQTRNDESAFASSDNMNSVAFFYVVITRTSWLQRS